MSSIHQMTMTQIKINLQILGLYLLVDSLQEYFQELLRLHWIDQRYLCKLNLKKELHQGKESYKFIMKEVLNPFFRGNGTNVIKVAPETALKFMFYDKIKNMICKDPKNPETYQSLISGGGAGAISSFIIYPLEVIKTRLSLQKSSNIQYNGIIDCCFKMINKEGPRSLYKGLTPSLLGIIPYASIDLCVYNYLRQLYIQNNNNDASTIVLMIFGATSTTCGQLISYPFSLIRTRLQYQGMEGSPKYYNGMMDCTIKIMQYEGFRGYYKGIIPNFLKSIPAVSISYGTFEFIKKRLIQNYGY